MSSGRVAGYAISCVKAAAGGRPRFSPPSPFLGQRDPPVRTARVLPTVNRLPRCGKFVEDVADPRICHQLPHPGCDREVFDVAAQTDQLGDVGEMFPQRERWPTGSTT